MTDRSSAGIGCFAPSCQNEIVGVGNDTIVNFPVAFCESHIDEWSEKDNIEITKRRSVAPGNERPQEGDYDV